MGELVGKEERGSVLKLRVLMDRGCLCVEFTWRSVRQPLQRPPFRFLLSWVVVVPCFSLYFPELVQNPFRFFFVNAVFKCQFSGPVFFVWLVERSLTIFRVTMSQGVKNSNGRGEGEVRFSIGEGFGDGSEREGHT